MFGLVVGGIVIDVTGELLALLGGFSAVLAALARSSALARTRDMRGATQRKYRGDLVEDATLIGAGSGLASAMVVLGLDLVLR